MNILDIGIRESLSKITSFLGNEMTKFQILENEGFLVTHKEKLDRFVEFTGLSFNNYCEISGGDILVNCKYLQRCAPIVEFNLLDFNFEINYTEFIQINIGVSPKEGEHEILAFAQQTVIEKGIYLQRNPKCMFNSRRNEQEKYIGLELYYHDNFFYLIKEGIVLFVSQI